jgi:hypothetical protein
MKILMEVFYRGYGIYYFDDCCKECIELETKGKRFEAVLLRDRMRGLISCREVLTKYELAVSKALKIIKKIETNINEGLKITYHDDDDNPKVEAWRWILVVPWRRIIFEQKRQALDNQKKVEEDKHTEKVNEKKEQVLAEVKISKVNVPEQSNECSKQI